VSGVQPLLSAGVSSNDCGEALEGEVVDVVGVRVAVVVEVVYTGDEGNNDRAEDQGVVWGRGE
jgi:hypothetical protein